MVVLYREKLYSLQDEEKLQKFMRLPENYWNLILPHKLPPKKKALPLSSLPMLGYMEQTVAATITKSLTAVGNFKPKYPFLTPTRSALVYVAYNLKANNPRNSDYIRKKYKRKLVEYENTCKLINYLGDNMTRRYKDPQNRPEEFDFKLEMFIQLKDKEPTSTWVA
ncbi:hypothetical protein CAPTEDRAFT_218532 [Capitella teleta]|nr:hypothetical protein CAPTEDRAFT_218532 [Capitella teleta]|eukprot:ELT97134.1 hypothetical protein CAPTEDRAFT_218532 [Capitella teleta]